MFSIYSWVFWEDFVSWKIIHLTRNWYSLANIFHWILSLSFQYLFIFYLIAWFNLGAAYSICFICSYISVVIPNIVYLHSLLFLGGGLDHSCLRFECLSAFSKEHFFADLYWIIFLKFTEVFLFVLVISFYCLRVHPIVFSLTTEMNV